ncbi:hypothetical protein GOODEAATRI_013772, partial [Goodea atripinnis]
MSKRQRDSLIAEVERHRQQQQQQQLQGDTQVTLSYPTKNRQDRSPQLLQPIATAYSYSGDAELLPYGAEVHPYLVCSPSDSQVSGMIYRDSQGRGDNSGHHDVRGFDSRQQPHDLMALHPYNPLDDLYNLYPHSLRNIDELCATIVRSHRETSQYRLEELQTLRWKVFSREEIQAYQSKTVDEMWQHCAVRLTDAVQYVVEFAKHVPGFRMLSQNDQIALLKTACNDLIAAVFDFAHGMCALKLTEQQLALFSALVLVNAGWPSFGPRSFPPGLQYAVQFPLGQPTPDNIQAICVHADHRPRYPDSYFPPSGFGKQTRMATAVNNAESWFSTCCKGNETWGTEGTLCCATQA